MSVSHAHYCEHCDRTFTCRRNCGFHYDITKAHKCWQRKWYANKVREAIASQDTKEPIPFPRRSPLAFKLPTKTIQESNNGDTIDLAKPTTFVSDARVELARHVEREWHKAKLGARKKRFPKFLRHLITE